MFGTLKTHFTIPILLIAVLLILMPLSVTAASVNDESGKVVYVTSDNIHNPRIDNKIVNNLVEQLRKNGVKAVNYGVGPNKHMSVLTDPHVPRDAVVVNIYGGACAATLHEMGTTWYKKIRGHRTVFTVFWSETSADITNLRWLPRAHDDNFSPDSFRGLAHPDTYLHQKGYHYIYTSNIWEIKEKITTYE